MLTKEEEEEYQRKKREKIVKKSHTKDYNMHKQFFSLLYHFKETNSIFYIPLASP